MVQPEFYICKSIKQVFYVQKDIYDQNNDVERNAGMLCSSRPLELETKDVE